MTLRTINKDFKKGIFIAGGITSLNDISQLKTAGIEGVIIGKALYEGKFELKEALNIVRE